MNRTLTSYNQSAKEYDRKFSGYEPYRRQMDRFVSLFNRRSKILDIGCGSGLNAQLFAKAGHSVTGFDFSESMIEIAKQNCPTGTFFTSAVDEFETSGKFDGICLSFIIVHLKDQDADKLFFFFRDILQRL